MHERNDVLLFVIGTLKTYVSLVFADQKRVALLLHSSDKIMRECHYKQTLTFKFKEELRKFGCFSSVSLTLLLTRCICFQ